MTLTTAGIITGALLIPIIATYPNWSYKEFYKRCEINAKHPDWRPKCAINFLESDPGWFIANGYAQHVKFKTRMQYYHYFYCLKKHK